MIKSKMSLKFAVLVSLAVGISSSVWAAPDATQTVDQAYVNANGSEYNSIIVNNNTNNNYITTYGVDATSTVFMSGAKYISVSKNIEEINSNTQIGSVISGVAENLATTDDSTPIKVTISNITTLDGQSLNSNLNNFASSDGVRYGSTINGDIVLKMTQDQKTIFSSADSASTYGDINGFANQSQIFGNVSATINNFQHTSGGISLASSDTRINGFYNSSVSGNAALLINNYQEISLSTENSTTESVLSGSKVKGLVSTPVSGDVEVKITSNAFINAPITSISPYSNNQAVGIILEELNSLMLVPEIPPTPFTYGNVDVKVNTTTTDGIAFYARSLMAQRSVLDLSSEDKTRILEGDIYTSRSGEIYLALNNAKSYLQGNIIDNSSYGNNIHLLISNDAQWRPIFDNRYGTDAVESSFNLDINKKDYINYQEGPSGEVVAIRSASNIALDNGGAINMSRWTADNGETDSTYGAPRYTVLNLDKFSSDDGAFIMDTDLASNTASDKIYINSWNPAGTQGTTAISVYDASLDRGTDVTGAHAVLLVTDITYNSDEVPAEQFIGKDLDDGGVWTITPTIENGLNVTTEAGGPGNANEFYLTKIAVAPTPNTEVLIDGSTNQYLMYRSSVETLRDRIGDVNQLNNQDSDVWGRYKGGKYGKDNVNLRYNMFQVGYSNQENSKSRYGISFEQTKGDRNFSYGNGDSTMRTVSLYGTWTSDANEYTDLVMRFGKIDSDLNSYGSFIDSASFNSRVFSLGVEYGKKFTLNAKNNLFIEPRAQLVYGHVSDANFTTSQGVKGHYGSMNSLIGRIGAVLGKDYNSGNWYFKADVLHEFNGDRNLSFASANGAPRGIEQSYGGTWVELGIGSNYQLREDLKLYGDLSRSFGGSTDKKWQVNAGVMFEF